MENILYYGDNLDILKRYIENESVDLIYLDPPFNSNQNYNVLFAEKDGSKAASQIQAFSDTWTWTQESEAVYADLVMAGGKVSDCLQAFRTFLGECDMLAYLVMMAPRLVELRRVLKSTGSIYLHCDPAASHYLKMLMDAAFGAQNFKNEIVWVRTGAHNDSKTCGNTHDILFLYTKSKEFLWNKQYQEYDKSYVESHYRYKDSQGRLFRTDNLTAMGLSGGGYSYEWNGVTKIWRCPKERMQEFHDSGRIRYTRTGTAEFIRYLDEMPGIPLQDVWNDIPPINSQAQERLGYPTQKPQALLERIINASCNPGDIVLDPFCGCGTTIAAAESLKRTWIGIDITHLAIGLIKNRLKESFKGDAKFDVIGEPLSVQGAIELAESDPFQFQAWALGLVGARVASSAKKGGDKGIDGKIIFQGDKPGTFETVIFSVKAGHTGPAHVRDLKGVLDREKAVIGVLISMQEPTAQMKTEAVTSGFYESATWGKKYPKVQLLTISELLEGKTIDMPPIRQVEATFKKAPKMKKKLGEQQELQV